MSLLWHKAAAFQRKAAWAPYDGEENIHPSEIERDHHADLTSPEARGKISSLADSIRQHGYSPVLHGKLHLNITDHGENLYGGEEGRGPEHHEHLLQALKDSGHGEVPVHIHDQRSDEDGTPAPRYYHGTTQEDLERIHPNHATTGNFGVGTHEPGHAYATSKENAWHYATRAADAYGGTPHVYEVSPRGPVEKDPTHDAHGRLRGNFVEDVRSKHGFDVVGEEEMPHDIRHMYSEDPENYESDYEDEGW